MQQYSSLRRFLLQCIFCYNFNASYSIIIKICKIRHRHTPTFILNNRLAILIQIFGFSCSNRDSTTLLISLSLKILLQSMFRCTISFTYCSATATLCCMAYVEPAHSNGYCDLIKFLPVSVSAHICPTVLSPEVLWCPTFLIISARA